MKNMNLVSKNNSVHSSEMPYVYMNNPSIMKIVNDSFGTMNNKFNHGQISTSDNLLTSSMSNCHFMISGNKFIPVAMDISISEPHREEHFNNSFTSNRIITSKQSTQGTVRKTRNNDSVALMPLPFSTQKRRDQQFMNTFSSNYETNNYTCTSMNEPVKSLKGASQLENNKSKIFRVKTIFCTGSIERILRWKRNLEDVFCIYETIAPIVSLQEGRVKNQKIMLLRDKKGPILQVQYYTSTHIDINDFYIGQYLRCVGRMIGFNILSAESIREAKESEISTLARLSYVCDYSVSHNLNTT